MPQEMSDITIMQTMGWTWQELQNTPNRIITHLAIKAKEDENYHQEEYR